MIRIAVVKKNADWPDDTIIRFFRDDELLGSLIVPDDAVDDFRAALPAYPPTPVVEMKRRRCTVCGTTDHHTDKHGNIVENPARVPVSHCWADELSQYEIGSEEWEGVMVGGNATCLLPAGHEGPHEFIPDSEIAVEFVWEEVEVDDGNLGN